MANAIISTIPQENKWLVTFDHSGPASYSQTNGDVVNAIDLGFGGIEFLNAAGDSSGAAYTWPIFNLASPSYTPPNVGSNATPSVQIHWFSFKTATVGGQAQTANAEMVNTTNLSTLSTRLQALCV